MLPWTAIARRTAATFPHHSAHRSKSRAHGQFFDVLIETSRADTSSLIASVYEPHFDGCRQPVLMPASGPQMAFEQTIATLPRAGAIIAQAPGRRATRDQASEGRFSSNWFP